MPYRFIDEVTRGLIQIHVERGILLPREITIEYSVSRQTVSRIRHNLVHYGCAEPPLFSVRGRPRDITAAIEEWIMLFLLDRPDAFHDEVAWQMYDEFDVHINPLVIGRTL